MEKNKIINYCAWEINDFLQLCNPHILKEDGEKALKEMFPKKTL